MESYLTFTLLTVLCISTTECLDILKRTYDSVDGDSAYCTDNINYVALAADGKTVDVNDFIVGVIENFREDMLTGIPELKIPVLDPFKSKNPITLNVEDEKASVHVNFTDIVVKGLSKFVLEYMHADLQNLSLRFDLTIPHIKVDGNYALDGKIIKIIPLRGNGTFWVESKNLSVSAKASMRNTEDNHLQLSDDFDVDMDFDKVEIYLENFLGGGRWTEILLKILNGISKDLFRKCMPLLKSELDKSLVKVINKHLSELHITSIIPGSSANEYIDQILVNVQNYINDKNLDPMKLPDYVYNFTKEVMRIKIRGEAKLYNGWLSGISSLHRTDGCDLESNRTTIAVSAHLGLDDLRLYYRGHAKFMFWGPSIEAGGEVKRVAFYFKIEQSNKKGAKPVLKEFKIVEMSTIWVEMSGLGPFTGVMKWMLTGLSTLVKKFIVDKVTLYIKEYMQNEFSKLSFPV